MNVGLRVTASNGVLANDSDAENDPLTAVLVHGTSHGTIYYLTRPDPPPDPGPGHNPPMAATWIEGLGADGSFKYVPDNGYRGPDNFTYQAQDIDGLSNVATVRFNVFGQPFVAKDHTYNVIPNAPLSVNAANGVLADATDAENDPPTQLNVVNGPLHGRVQLNRDGSFTYTPTQGFTGQDSFKYQVQDQDGLSNVAAVTLIVQRQPPVARDKSYQLTLGDTLVVDAAHGVKVNDTDAEGDPMTPTLQSGPNKGQLQFNADGSFSYTFTGSFPPHAGVVTDSFTYVERDQDGTSNVATVRIQVVRPDSGGDVAVARDAAAAVPVSDATAQLDFSYGSFVFDAATHHYKQTVTIRNSSAKAIVGPLSLVLDNLTAGVTLVNKTGTTAKQGQAGNPYVDVALANDVLDAGLSVTVVLEFANPTAAITYRARVLAGSGQR